MRLPASCSGLALGTVDTSRDGRPSHGAGGDLAQLGTGPRGADPAVRALLDLVADDPERAFRVLGTVTVAE